MTTMRIVTFDAHEEHGTALICHTIKQKLVVPSERGRINGPHPPFGVLVEVGSGVEVDDTLMGLKLPPTCGLEHERSLLPSLAQA
jgi:hypothetical protein